MFRLEDTKLESAIKRAKELHPKVRMQMFGIYEVTGSKGNTYMVSCYRDEEGFKTVDCECTTRDGVACKHGLAAVPLHRYVASYRAQSAH